MITIQNQAVTAVTPVASSIDKSIHVNNASIGFKTLGKFKKHYNNNDIKHISKNYDYLESGKSSSLNDGQNSEQIKFMRLRKSQNTDMLMKKSRSNKPNNPGGLANRGTSQDEDKLMGGAGVNLQQMHANQKFKLNQSSSKIEKHSKEAQDIVQYEQPYLNILNNGQDPCSKNELSILNEIVDESIISKLKMQCQIKTQQLNSLKKDYHNSKTLKKVAKKNT